MNIGFLPRSPPDFLDTFLVVESRAAETWQNRELSQHLAQERASHPWLCPQIFSSSPSCASDDCYFILARLRGRLLQFDSWLLVSYRSRD